MLRVAVARMPADDAAMPAWLGDSERRRWQAIGPAARGAFAASRALLRELLQAVSGVPFADWRVSAEAGTAPRVEAPGVAHGAWHASLSHRLGWVAAAVADTAIGIDLECDRTPRSVPDERAALMLAPAELVEWHALPDADREAALLARWTAKEAWFKASPPETAPWDFRRIAAIACPRADANVRTWTAPPLHVALSCADAPALATADCEGLAFAMTHDSFWRVHRVAFAT